MSACYTYLKLVVGAWLTSMLAPSGTASSGLVLRNAKAASERGSERRVWSSPKTKTRTRKTLTWYPRNDKVKCNSQTASVCRYNAHQFLFCRTRLSGADSPSKEDKRDKDSHARAKPTTNLVFPLPPSLDPTRPSASLCPALVRATHALHLFRSILRTQCRDSHKFDSRPGRRDACAAWCCTWCDWTLGFHSEAICWQERLTLRVVAVGITAW